VKGYVYTVPAPGARQTFRQIMGMTLFHHALMVAQLTIGQPCSGAPSEPQNPGSGYPLDGPSEPPQMAPEHHGQTRVGTR